MGTRGREIIGMDVGQLLELVVVDIPIGDHPRCKHEKLCFFGGPFGPRFSRTKDGPWLTAFRADGF